MPNGDIKTFSQNALDWLADYGKTFSHSQILEIFAALSEKRILIVGESIVDRYTRVDALGKATKDPILVFMRGLTTNYLGGILSVGNFCRSIVEKLTIATSVNLSDDYLRNYMRNNLFCDEITLLTKQPTITKHRYIDVSNSQKVFETYDFDVLQDLDLAFYDVLRRHSIDSFDATLVVDYGHGLIGQQTAKLLTDSSKFLAINTQTNAGNRGYNTLDKYDRADFFAMNTGELRIQARNANPNFANVISNLCLRLNSEGAIVTDGAQGLTLYKKTSQFRAPGLASRIVDKIGAGDVVFTLASLLELVEAPPEVSVMLVSIVAALEVGELGHIERWDLSELLGLLESISKGK